MGIHKISISLQRAVPSEERQTLQGDKMLSYVLLLSLAASSFAAGSKQPNILWIFADDLGYHDIGFRSDLVKTPNLDRLAKEGVIYTNSYVQQQCTPSRHSFTQDVTPTHLA